MRTTNVVGAAVVLCLAVATVPTAHAFYTYINPLGGGDGSEPSLIAPGGILDDLYGLANLERVPDDIDQGWFNLDGLGKAEVKHAASEHYFGYYVGLGPGGSFNTLGPTTPGHIYTFDQDDTGANFRFGLWRDPDSGPKWSSLMADNSPGNYDHMVTWKVAGVDHPRYVIAWEDLNLGDRDYNDSVIQIDYAEPIPEPTVLTLLGLGLGATLMRRRLRRSTS